jgi:hypothetical protein
MTPRGPVDVVRQEIRALPQTKSWAWFWIARRKGRSDWSEASTAREAIRMATLLPPRKPPAWLLKAAVEAERKIMDPTDAEASDGPSAPPPPPAEQTKEP